MDSSKVLALAKEKDVKFVNLQFTDFLGAVKSVTIPVQHLPESLERGTWFDGSSIEGFARICESDMFLKPDPDTFAVVPWRPKEKAVARMFCDVYSRNGTPFEGDPRYILKKMIEEAKKEGFVYNTGPELEFFLFKTNGEPLLTKPVPHDTGGYFDYSPMDLASDVRRDAVLAIEAMGLNVEMSHHEVAPGQHEIDFKYADALTTADNAITLKNAFKAVAQAHSLFASFMPKPIFGENGSGMHVHQSLFSIRTGKSAFFDQDDKYNLSPTAKSFIAGQLKYIREISAITAPTVNSYKRLVPGYEAPVYVCWGRQNRSALIRVPSYSKGREQSMRAELRCPDPSCNPYLAFAAMLGAGLEGIKENLELSEPIEEDVYEFDDAKLKDFYIKTLPGSLAEAISEMENGTIAKKVLGEQTLNRYIATKKQEWDEYRIHVTDWELSRYLQVL